MPVPSYFPIEFFSRKQNSPELQNMAQFHDRPVLFYYSIFIIVLFLWLNYINVIYDIKKADIFINNFLLDIIANA